MATTEKLTSRGTKPTEDTEPIVLLDMSEEEMGRVFTINPTGRMIRPDRAPKLTLDESRYLFFIRPGPKSADLWPKASHEVHKSGGMGVDIPTPRDVTALEIDSCADKPYLQIDYDVTVICASDETIFWPRPDYGDMKERWSGAGFLFVPRSSISKSPLRHANPPGVIDADYRGSLIGRFDVKRGGAMVPRGKAQMQILAPDGRQARYIVVGDESRYAAFFGATARGAGAFGSTGDGTTSAGAGMSADVPAGTAASAAAADTA